MHIIVINTPKNSGIVLTKLQCEVDQTLLYCEGLTCNTRIIQIS